MLVSTIAGPLGKATQAATGIPSNGAEKAISETVHQLSSGFAKFEDFFTHWLRRNLSVDDQNLYFSAAELYADKFNTGIVKLTQSRPMIIAFDTYEWLIPISKLDEQIRSLMMLPLLRATNRIAFVVSGRHDLSMDYRRSFEGTTLLRLLPLLPFNADVEIEQYLANNGIPKNLKDIVAKKTMGVPQAVSTLISMIKQSNMNVGIGDSEESLISDLDESHVVAETTLRFLRYCYETLSDSPEKAQQKRLDRQKIFALTLLRRYDLGALIQCWDVIGGKQLGSAEAVNKNLTELRQRYSFVFDQGRDRMHELVKRFTRQYLKNRISSEHGFIDRSLVQRLAKRLDEHYEATRNQHPASSKSLDIQYNNVDWLGITLDLVYSRFWYTEQGAWELVAKTFLEASIFNRTWLRNLTGLLDDFQPADSRLTHLFVDGIEAILSMDISDEIESDLLSFIARQSHWKLTNTHKALICLRQAKLFNRENQEKKALEKLLDSLSFVPENEIELKNSVLNELERVGAWLLFKQDYESAEKAFLHVFNIDNGRTEVQGQLIMSLLPQSKFDEAERFLEGFEDNKSIQLLLARSNLNFFQGRVSEAVDSYREVLKIDPNYLDNILNELSDPMFFDFILEFTTGFLSSADSNTSLLEARVMENITTVDELKEYLNIQHRYIIIDTPTPHDNLQLGESLVKLFPNSKEVKIQLAKFQMGAKKYKESINTASQLLDTEPEIASQANTLLGSIKIIQGKPKDALALFEKSLDLDSNNAQAKVQIMTTLRFLKRDDEALEKGLLFIEENPENVNIKWLLGELLLATGQQEKGTELLRQALKQDPQRLDRIYSSITTMPKIFRNFYLMRLLPEEVKWITYLDADIIAIFWKQMLRSQIFDEELEFDDEILQRATENISKKVKDKPEDWAVLGEFYAIVKQYDSAEKAYNRSIKLNPKDPVVLSGLAEVYLALNQQENAIPLLKKSAELKPRAAPYLKLAEIYEKKGLTDKAFDAYEKAIEVEPKNVSAVFNLAIFYDKQGNSVDAIKTITQAISLDPQKAFLYRNRAKQFIKTRQLERAQVDLEFAGKLEPNAPYLYFRYAEYYYCTRKFDKVEENALKALELNKEFTIAKFWLALAQLAQKKTLDSIDTYRSAIPDFDESDLRDAKGKINEVMQELGQVSGADIVLNMLDNALADLKTTKEEPSTE